MRTYQFIRYNYKYLFCKLINESCPASLLLALVCVALTVVALLSVVEGAILSFTLVMLWLSLLEVMMAGVGFDYTLSSPLPCIVVREKKVATDRRASCYQTLLAKATNQDL